MKDILQRIDIAELLTKWGIELSEFRIEYKRRRAINFQTLADFVAECSFFMASSEATEEGQNLVQVVEQRPHNHGNSAPMDRRLKMVVDIKE